MKQFTMQRNERIRKDYQKYVRHYKMSGEKKPAQKAIQDLVHQYSVFELTFETIQQIVSNAKYGISGESTRAKKSRKSKKKENDISHVPAT